MTKSHLPRHAELRVALDITTSELVRGFVREACLSEGVSLATASLVAGDTAQVWRVLCGLDPDHSRAHLETRGSAREITVRIILPGHDRFSRLADCLPGQVGAGTGLSWREHGIDGWEVGLHRSATEAIELISSVAEDISTGDEDGGGSSEYTIDVPTRDDAPAVARCFLAVYGHNYVHPEVFSPRYYWAKVEQGELIPIIARDNRGEVVGHVALERALGSVVAERGEAVVLASHRGHRLLEKMTERLSQEAVGHDLVGIYAEPVTIHTYSQRNDERAGMPVCAVLLGVNPENTHAKGMATVASQRQSYLRTFRFVAPPVPRVAFAPAPYREVLQGIYRRLGVTLTEAAAADETARTSRTSVRVTGRGYGVIGFDQIGPSADVELAQALRDVQALGARSVQLSTRISDPRLPDLTDAARKLGFFFCGLGPAFAAGDDLFLLQRLNDPLDTNKLQLFTEQSKGLVDFIDADRFAVASLT